MPEIAYTSLGRNTLLMGLISHNAALLIAMMSVSGAVLFFSIVFLFSCLAILVGAYAELKNRGDAPLRSPQLYIIAAATFFPLIGPFIVFGLLYRFIQMGGKREFD